MPPTLPSPQPASPITRTLILIHNPTAGCLTLPLVTTGSTLLKAGPPPGLCPYLADFPLFCVTLKRLAPSLSFLFPFTGQISLCFVYCVRHSYFSSSVLNQSRKQHTGLAHCGGENSGLYVAITSPPTPTFTFPCLCIFLVHTLDVLAPLLGKVQCFSSYRRMTLHFLEGVPGLPKLDYI